MQIFDDIARVRCEKNTVVTLGTFDGVHLGHKKIIDKVVEKAKSLNGRSFLITFYPHPRKVVSTQEIKILSDPAEKASLFEDLGIDNLLVIKFTEEFSQLTSEEFLNKYIINGTGVSEFVIGYDHHFGKGRGGNEATLREIGKEFDFNVTAVDEVKIDDIIVSSSKVRKALETGDIKRVNGFLGRYYSFSGTVIEGDKRGRTLGYPTANVKLNDADKMLPALGIYFVEFLRGTNKHYGLLSIGKRPTFYNAGEVTAEVYLYDFNEEIYGEQVTVSIVEKLRDEEKFNSAEDLITQMNKDRQKGFALIESLKK